MSTLPDTYDAWTIASAVWQIEYGQPSNRTKAASAWLVHKINDGAAFEVSDIAARLLDAVAALREKEEEPEEGKQK